jgi:hypothetical protein
MSPDSQHDLRAAADVEDVDRAAVLVDPVDDAVGATPGAVTSGSYSKLVEQELDRRGE